MKKKKEMYTVIEITADSIIDDDATGAFEQDIVDFFGNYWYDSYHPLDVDAYIDDICDRGVTTMDVVVERKIPKAKRAEVKRELLAYLDGYGIGAKLTFCDKVN